MGNRACIVFFDRNRVSPRSTCTGTATLSQAGWTSSRSLCRDGSRDASYAAARFVGICHANIDGNLSLGISSNDFSLADVRNKDRMEDHSPGNAGIVAVDTSDFTWKAYGGYLADSDRRQP